MISRRELLSPEGLSKALRRDVSKVEAGTPKMLDQSDVYVLSVTWSDEAPTETLLLKHVSMQSLRQRFNRPDSKWRISLLSFENEYCFYESRPTLQVRRQTLPRSLTVHCLMTSNMAAEGGGSSHTRDVLHQSLDRGGSVGPDV
jgi:hypothetical protein